MAKVGESERKTQNNVIKFFVDKLRYTYLGNLHDVENKNIMEDKLKSHLKEKGYSETLINKAIEKLVKTSNNLEQGLYHANKEVYSLLKYGVKVKENAGESPKTVVLIDYENISANDFYIAEEVTVVGDNTKRPDIVIYINGIALAVLELKKSTISVSDGIRQNLTNQKANFIQQFFTTMQFCIAGNNSEGVRYGTLLTPEKYYLEWADDGFTEFADERDETDILIEEKCKEISDKLFKGLFALFYKRRFLDLVYNFVIFDKGIKKVCRYNQYYAIKRAQKRLAKCKNGIVWHTQGSGKSLTMVWLSKWILENKPNARVLIVTDREELDDQIEKLYKGVDEQIVRSKSGKNLISILDSYEERMICSLVHKFGRKGGEINENDYDKYIEDLYQSLPANFEAKGDFYVFVDEAHRTQSGKLHKAMKAILPKAIFVGFTGTPLLKKDKKTTLEIFGGYIHTYKFDEGVRDGVILDLRYDARDIPQELTSQEKIDAWFEVKTKGLTPRAKARLKQHWGNLQTIFSSRSRLEVIVKEIIMDFATKPRLMDGNGNAMLVASSIYEACKYYEIFQEKGFKKCAIISSYEPNVGDLRTDTVSDEEDTENFEKYEIYNKMLGGKDVATFETEAKRKFIDEPANMQLLIVVDKLLTGFDAPPCTYLYVDKSMHDHGLFQAICRVNRLDDDSKEFGYIVDFKQLFGDLTQAINDYTSGAFESYDEEDIDGLIKDRTDEVKKYFENTLNDLESLCDGVKMPRELVDYIHYFCGENGIDEGVDEAFARIREKLYKLTGRLIRAFAEVKPSMDDIGYTPSQKEKFEEKVAFYINLRDEIGRASGDFLDLKAYEPGMRYLIDNFIKADDAQKIGMFDDFTLLDFIIAQQDKIDGKDGKSAQESAAETIENNIRKKVVQKIVINPAYYSKMSEVLELLILDRKSGVIEYKQLIAKYIELCKNIENPENNTKYPVLIAKNQAMRALYDNCGENEELAVNLHAVILKAKQDGFRTNPVKENKVKRAMYQLLKNEAEVERLYKIVVEQEEY